MPLWTNLQEKRAGRKEWGTQGYYVGGGRDPLIQLSAINNFLY